jgi:hypothetical protein
VQRNERSGCVDLIDIGNFFLKGIDIGNWEVALCAAGGPQRGDDSGRVGRRNERSEAGRKFRFDESKTSQAEIKKRQAKLLLHLSLSLSTVSLSTLSLSSRHTTLPPSPSPRKDNQPAGGRGGGERKTESRVRPPIPFCSNRRRRFARDPLRVPRRCACPLARGERRSTPSAADRRRGTPLLRRPIRRFLTPTAPPVGCRGRPVAVTL